jgi:hypothetical protein
MLRRELTEASRPERMAAAVERQARALAEAAPGHGHGGPVETVRQATYKRHKIVIWTSYRVEVDGAPVEAHFGVSNDGRVHYHGLPNLSLPSAVDLVKRLIDAYPEDFTRPPSRRRRSGHEH